MQIKGFFNDEEKKEIKEFVENLLEDKSLRAGDFVESGLLGVKFDYEDKDGIYCDIYRTVGLITIKKEKKQ